MPTPTAEEYLQPLLPGLVPVPAVQPGVCPICRTAANDGYNDCYHCAGQTVSVIPISLSIHSELLHHHLRHYKDNPHADVRQKLTIRLAALIELFLRHHLDSCLGGPVHQVATVPSQHRDAPWGIIRWLGRFAGQTNPLTYQPEHRFVATANLQDQRVLLVDDTFTSGQSLFAAHQALTDAGAEVAGPLVIGRHVRPDWPPSAELLQRLKSMQWSVTRCCRCAGVVYDPPLRDKPTSLFGN